MILLATHGELYVARLPGAREAEGDGVAGGAVAGEGAGAVIIGVAVRARARRLEHETSRPSGGTPSALRMRRCSRGLRDVYEPRHALVMGYYVRREN